MSSVPVSSAACIVCLQSQCPVQETPLTSKVSLCRSAAPKQHFVYLVLRPLAESANAFKCKAFISILQKQTGDKGKKRTAALVCFGSGAGGHLFVIQVRLDFAHLLRSVRHCKSTQSLSDQIHPAMKALMRSQRGVVSSRLTPPTSTEVGSSRLWLCGRVIYFSSLFPRCRSACRVPEVLTGFGLCSVHAFEADEVKRSDQQPPEPGSEVWHSHVCPAGD